MHKQYRQTTTHWGLIFAKKNETVSLSAKPFLTPLILLYYTKKVQYIHFIIVKKAGADKLNILKLIEGLVVLVTLKFIYEKSRTYIDLLWLKSQEQQSSAFIRRHLTLVAQFKLCNYKNNSLQEKKKNASVQLSDTS